MSRALTLAVKAISAFCAAALACAPVLRAGAAQSIPIPQTGVTFETGDTWMQGTQRMRLYGVQACLRGTAFVNSAGVQTDCGEASLAYLAAVVRDLKPTCTPVAQLAEPPQLFVVCSAKLDGQTLDLGTILITAGFGFAAFGADGKPVYPPYLVAELVAKKANAGLWGGQRFSHPTQLLLHVPHE